MSDIYVVIGVRWSEKSGHWKLRKKIECVSKDRMVALQIAQHLNNTQTRYEFSVDVIPDYDSMSDYMYFEW